MRDLLIPHGQMIPLVLVSLRRDRAVVLRYRWDIEKAPSLLRKVTDAERIERMRRAAGEIHALAAETFENEKVLLQIWAECDEGDPIPRALYPVVAELMAPGLRQHGVELDTLLEEP